MDNAQAFPAVDNAQAFPAADNAQGCQAQAPAPLLLATVKAVTGSVRKNA